MGRPSVYAKEIADEICERLATGESLRRICRDVRMPGESTVRSWVISDIDGFAAQYARSRDLGLDAMADEILDIADDGTNDWAGHGEGQPETLNTDHIQRSRLRVDSRKWYLSKLAPKRYGDKVALTGGDGGAVQFEFVTVYENQD